MITYIFYPYAHQPLTYRSDHMSTVSPSFKYVSVCVNDFQSVFSTDNLGNKYVSVKFCSVRQCFGLSVGTPECIGRASLFLPFYVAICLSIWRNDYIEAYIHGRLYLYFLCLSVYFLIQRAESVASLSLCVFVVVARSKNWCLPGINKLRFSIEGQNYIGPFCLAMMLWPKIKECIWGKNKSIKMP